MGFALVLVVLVSTATADTLDLKKTVAKIDGCSGESDGLAPLGPIERIETIGKRSPEMVVHVIGKKARGYVVFGQEFCEVIPVVGKPAAYAKGNFGQGATTAYALVGARCTDPGACHGVVSLKDKGDKLVDLLVVDLCEDGMTLAKRAVFAGRDSLELGCFTSGGADMGRRDYLLDAASGRLLEMLAVDAGIGWIQIEDGKQPRCRLRIPGGIKVVTAGANPELDATSPATPEESTAAKAEHTSGGCDITIATRRFVLDKAGAKFVAKPGAPRVTTKKNFCQCTK